MVKLKQLLLEDDTDFDFYDMMNEMFVTVLGEFLSGKYKKQPWPVVKYQKVKKVWSDFAKSGFVRDEKPLEDIANQFTYLFLKLYVNTTLLGHTSENPQEYFDDYGMSEEQIEKFCDWTDTPTGGYRLSDYALKPLYNLFIKLRRAKSAEERLIWCSKILDVTHARSNLSSWFVEGGNRSLDDLAGYEKTFIDEPAIHEKLITIYEQVKKINNKYFYVGDCVTGLDDTYFTQHVAEDATELQQLVDNSKKISKIIFIKLTGVNSNSAHFGYNSDKNVIWEYDTKTDVHQFYLKL